MVKKITGEKQGGTNQGSEHATQMRADIPATDEEKARRQEDGAQAIERSIDVGKRI
jgi:hypothetical protein